MNLQELAAALELEFKGDPTQVISALAPIDRAGDTDLAFVVGSRYSSVLRESKAGAVIVPQSMTDRAPGNYLVSADPYASYAKASWLLQPAEMPVYGVHESAIVDATAVIAAGASVGPGVVIGAGSVVQEGVVVGAHCFIGSGVHVGRDSLLFPRVTLYNKVTLGEGCRVQSGAVIGSEGFGYAWTQQGWSQIQQTGGVHLGQGVHVGANTTIDCGAIDPTFIDDGVILDNQVQIAHNVRIGKHTAIAGCVGIAGSTTVGSYCQIGGACNIVGHLNIADRVVLNAASLVTRSITQAGRYGSGMPLQVESQWRRSFVNLGRLDDIFKRIRRLERSNATD